MSDIVSGRFVLERPSFRLDSELRIPVRGVSGIFGHSGCGKTTLLRCLAGLERSPQGYLVVDGDLWQDEEAGVFLPPYRRSVGMVFQEPRLFSHLTVKQNLLYGFNRKANDHRVVHLDSVVEMLGVAALLSRRPDSLSGGEQQRVAIGRALLAHPKLLLMDEPLANLDYRRKAEIMPFLERLHRELDIPVIYVSHQMDELSRLADYLLLMENGRIVAGGSLAEIQTRLDLFPADEDALTIWNGRVERLEAEFDLAWVNTESGLVGIAGSRSVPGDSIRIAIHARDVTLCLEKPGGSTSLNVLPATVRELRDHGGGQVNVRLDVGANPLLSRITWKSCRLLDIAPGKSVYVQFKSVALQDRF